MRIAHLTLLALVLFACVSCGDSSGGSDGEIPASAHKEAADLFKLRCSTCHGETGGGDGPSVKALKARPASFQQPAWQDAITDQRIEKIILAGGAAVGKSAEMPPNADLQGKRDVVRALRLIVRGLRKK